MLEKTEFQTRIGLLAGLINFEIHPDSYKYDDREATLIKDNLNLTIQQNQYRNDKRITIQGHFPRAKNGKFVSYPAGDHVITVAETKSAAQIANDINKRLMPSYLEAVARVQEKVNNWNNIEDMAKAEVDKLLAGITGAEYSSNYDRGTYSYYRSLVFISGQDLPRVEIRIGTEGHKLEIDYLTSDHIIAIMKLIGRA